MPRLGHDSDDDFEQHGQRRQTATPYPYTQQNQAYKVVLLIALIFVVRNVILRDYRLDAKNFLKHDGQMTDDEIEKYVPKTYYERQQRIDVKKRDSVQMKEELEILKQEVKQLKMKVFGTENILSTNVGETEENLKL